MIFLNLYFFSLSPTLHYVPCLSWYTYIRVVVQRYSRQYVRGRGRYLRLLFIFDENYVAIFFTRYLIIKHDASKWTYDRVPFQNEYTTLIFSDFATIILWYWFFLFWNNYYCWAFELCSYKKSKKTRLISKRIIKITIW